MKTCTKCNTKQELCNFHNDKASKDGVYRWCKICKREYDKKYRNSDKIQTMYKSEDYKLKKLKQFNDNFLKYKLISIKAGIPVNERALRFTITEDDLIMNEFCPLLNVKLDYKVGRGRPNWNTASVDRIDNSKGYVPGNVWIISRLANTMKNRASIDELLLFAENINKIFNKN